MLTRNRQGGEFFVEGSQFFTFGTQGGTFSNAELPTLFFSRSIGLQNGGVVPIVGGARLMGKSLDEPLPDDPLLRRAPRALQQLLCFLQPAHGGALNP